MYITGVEALLSKYACGSENGYGRSCNTKAVLYEQFIYSSHGRTNKLMCGVLFDRYCICVGMWV